MVQIPKGLKTYTLESVPNFQKRSNGRRIHCDWKTSCSLLGTEQMLQFKHEGSQTLLCCQEDSCTATSPIQQQSHTDQKYPSVKPIWRGREVDLVLCSCAKE